MLETTETLAASTPPNPAKGIPRARRRVRSYSARSPLSRVSLTCFAESGCVPSGMPQNEQGPRPSCSQMILAAGGDGVALALSGCGHGPPFFV